MRVSGIPAVWQACSAGHPLEHMITRDILDATPPSYTCVTTLMSDAPSLQAAFERLERDAGARTLDHRTKAATASTWGVACSSVRYGSI